MPWTFAHPAAVLPLRKIGRFRLPLAALVVVSIAPDFGYYSGQFRLGTFAHSVPGIFLVSASSRCGWRIAAGCARSNRCRLRQALSWSACATSCWPAAWLARALSEGWPLQRRPIQAR